jgi:hypothetical protein
MFKFNRREVFVMEYNVELKILFERSMLEQLFSAYKYDFPHHELVDEVYSCVRTFVPGADEVQFVYRNNGDYRRLVSFICKKLNVEY